MALTQPKKPVGGAYGVFLAEKRGEFAKACEGQQASAVTKLAGEAWKKLTPAQQDPYQKKYEAAKAKFDSDMKAFLEAGGQKQKGPTALRAEKRKAEAGKKSKDKNAPKRPSAGGYGVFLAEKRAEIVKGLPEGHKVSDVAKKAGELWSALSGAAKSPYEAKYKERMAEYKAALEEYKKTSGGAGAAEEGDEEEEDEEDEGDEPATKKPAGAA